MKKLVFALLAVLSMTSGVSAQLAQRRPPPRQQLERQLGERIAAVVKKRLNLSDAQMMQLQRVNQRVERQRLALLVQERQTRRQLRDELQLGDAANQPRVAELVDRGFQIQRQRLDLAESEQKELAAFMTPLQRAQYLGIQEQIRRRMEEMRRRQAGPPMQPNQ
jgi:periplasmic protein CpxP/Spy